MYQKGSVIGIVKSLNRKTGVTKCIYSFVKSKCMGRNGNWRGLNRIWETWSNISGVLLGRIWMSIGIREGNWLLIIDVLVGWRCRRRRRKWGPVVSTANRLWLLNLVGGCAHCIRRWGNCLRYCGRIRRLGEIGISRGRNTWSHWAIGGGLRQD